MKIALKVKAKNGVLQDFIDRKGWTQADFARAVDLHATHVGDWFNMKNYPRTEDLMERVSILVEKPPEDIFPSFMRDPKFLALTKTATIYQDMNIEMLSFDQVPQIEYNPSENADLEMSFKKVFRRLTAREQDVIERRFGMNGKEEQRLEEIAKDLGFSRERIRQLEAKALRKLRHPSRCGKWIQKKDEEDGENL